MFQPRTKILIYRLLTRRNWERLQEGIKRKLANGNSKTSEKRKKTLSTDRLLEFPFLECEETYYVNNQHHTI